MPDELGRPILSEGMKAQMDAALAVIPDGKRGALLIIADENGVRAMLAAKLGSSWRVAAGAGISVSGHRRGGIYLSGSW